MKKWMICRNFQKPLVQQKYVLRAVRHSWKLLWSEILGYPCYMIWEMEKYLYLLIQCDGNACLWDLYSDSCLLCISSFIFINLFESHFLLCSHIMLQLLNYSFLTVTFLACFLSRWSAQFGSHKSGAPEIHAMLAEYIFSESPEVVGLFANMYLLQKSGNSSHMGLLKRLFMQSWCLDQRFSSYAILKHKNNFMEIGSLILLLFFLLTFNHDFPLIVC